MNKANPARQKKSFHTTLSILQWSKKINKVPTPLAHAAPINHHHVFFLEIIHSEILSKRGYQCKKLQLSIRSSSTKYSSKAKMVTMTDDGVIKRAYSEHPFLGRGLNILFLIGAQRYLSSAPHPKPVEYI